MSRANAIINRVATSIFSSKMFFGGKEERATSNEEPHKILVRACRGMRRSNACFLSTSCAQRRVSHQLCHRSKGLFTYFFSGIPEPGTFWCSTIVAQTMGHTMDPAMVNHGMFHGATRGGKGAPCNGRWYTVNGPMVCTAVHRMACTLSGPWCTVKHSMVYSMVPNDARADISSMHGSTHRKRFHCTLHGHPLHAPQKMSWCFPWLATWYMYHGTFRENEAVQGICHKSMRRMFTVTFVAHPNPWMVLWIGPRTRQMRCSWLPRGTCHGPLIWYSVGEPMGHPMAIRHTRHGKRIAMYAME